MFNINSCSACERIFSTFGEDASPVKETIHQYMIAKYIYIYIVPNKSRS